MSKLNRQSIRLALTGVIVSAWIAANSSAENETNAPPALTLREAATLRGLATRPLRIYVDSGDAGDSRDGVADTAMLADVLRAAGYRDGVDLRYVVQPGATHNEVYWAQRLPGALGFLLGRRDP